MAHAANIGNLSNALMRTELIWRQGMFQQRPDDAVSLDGESDDEGLADEGSDDEGSVPVSDPSSMDDNPDGGEM